VLDRIGRHLPRSLALYLVALAAVALVLAFLKGIQDPDYFWHLETGEWIASQGLPDTDPFSFTYRGEWTLHEWLGQLFIFQLDSALGPSLSLVVFGLIPPVAIATVAVALARRDVPSRAIVAATILCGAVLIPYVTIRPQVISWLLLAALIALLLEVRPKRTWPLLAVPPLFILWANVHGLYVIGLGVLALFAAFTLLGRTELAGRRWAVAGTGAAALLASAVTPAGPAGLLYPLRYVDAGDWGLANIPEWQSPSFHDLVQLPLLALIIVLAVIGRVRGQGWLFTIAYLSIVGALIANRNTPVAAVASLPALAFGLAPLVRRREQTLDPARRVVEAAAVGAVVVGALLLLPSTPGAHGVSLDRYPASAVAAIEADSGTRVLAEYGWAGYVIHELADDGALVFVDGRNDMYPEEILDAYSTVRAANPGWTELVERHGVNLMLFPPDAPIVRGVAQADGWCEAFRNTNQVLLIPCRA
jgi:hypothetical protein